MNNKFMSKKSNGLGALLLSVSILILFLSFGLPLILKQSIGLTELIIKTLISILVIGLFIWCWTNTFYVIDKTRLKVICGPFKFHVKIQDIKELTTNQKSIGWITRPTLSWICIVIEYGDFKTLSISPENQDRFIDSLKAENNQIKINYSA
jgi:hypothetical protein